MYNHTQLLQELSSLVGWREHEKISETLSISDSGMYFQAEHPLLTIDNILSIAPFNDKAEFSAWLKTKTEDAIMKTIQRVVSGGRFSQLRKGIIKSNVVYPFPLEKRVNETGNDVVVMEINLAKVQGLALRLVRIGICLSNTANVVINLWNSEKGRAVNFWEYRIDEASTVVWFPVDTSLIGSKWFISLTANEGVISTASTRQQNLSRYVKIKTLLCKEESLAGFAEGVEVGRNYGLNLQIAVESDLTEFLINHKKSFAGLIGKGVAISLLREMAFNPNFNISRRTENLRTAEVLYELDGDSSSVKKSGLKFEFDEMLKNIDLNLSELDDLVFVKKKGIKIGTIG